MYSLIRSLIGLNEARMLIQVSVVVRTTRTSDSPSIPTLYWIPNVGTQPKPSTNWNGRDAGALAALERGARGRIRLRRDDQEPARAPRERARGGRERARERGRRDGHD